MFSLKHTRRNFLRSSVGLAGLTLPTFFKAQAVSTPKRRKAKACIVIYTWGGMSHYESFDPKPEAPVDIRGEFKSINTATPGIQFSEHIPLLAKHSNKLAIVRSVHHNNGAHSGAVYLNLTGHQPEGQIKAKGRKNWPSITSVISHFHRPLAGIPNAIRMPYSMYDNGRQMAAKIPANKHHTIDGISLLNTWKQSKSLSKRRALFWHYPLEKPHFLGGISSGAIRYGDWKLIERFNDNSIELYNLTKDPSETVNLAEKNRL